MRDFPTASAPDRSADLGKAGVGSASYELPAQPDASAASQR